MLYDAMQEILSSCANMADAEQVLEAIVDRYGLEKILYSLRTIALAKADFVKETWQDNQLAKDWAYDAMVISKASEKVIN